MVNNIYKKQGRYQTKYLKNKVMNKDTYALRRKVMSFIYDAKALDPTLPRITVRITDNNSTTLGVGRMKGNTIWITDKAINCKDYQLRNVVFHEILHATYGVPHSTTCPLMSPVIQKIPKAKAEARFKYWVKKYQ